MIVALVNFEPKLALNSLDIGHELIADAKTRRCDSYSGMNKSDTSKFQSLYEKGDLATLAKELKPYFENGDLDARYLASGFSVDPNETGEALDLRRIQELKALASKWHIPSMIDLAWAYRHGDDVERDIQKFQNLISAAALLGDKGAGRTLAEFLEFEIGVPGLSSLLARQNG